MLTPLQAKLQEHSNGPFIRLLREFLWIDFGKGRMRAGVRNIFDDEMHVTLLDALDSENKNSWRTHSISDLQQADVVSLLVWGAGRGLTALPRFRQADVVENFYRAFMEGDRHNFVFIALRTPHLADWISFVEKFGRTGADVQVFGPGAPFSVNFEGTEARHVA